MREVPIERNEHALRFAAALLSGRFDMMIFLTGVGTAHSQRLWKPVTDEKNSSRR